MTDSPSMVRVGELLDHARHARVVVVGDVMLDHFVWGRVSRISPEAPVPILEFDRESYMPGGAANVARNLSALSVPTHICGVVGRDETGSRLRAVLEDQAVGCAGLIPRVQRPTALKTRVVAQRQQLVRIDREQTQPIDESTTRRLLRHVERLLDGGTAVAVIVCDYAKGVVTQGLIEGIKELCRPRGIWLSLDPKPPFRLDLTGMSLLTPNRKEAFALANEPESPGHLQPLKDAALLTVAKQLLRRMRPAVLMITLGENGMLLCQRDCPPRHIPTVTREVFDVSGAGDTVIAAFTAAIAAGASSVEAAVISNHAAGVVVGKVGTASVAREELLESFKGG